RGDTRLAVGAGGNSFPGRPAASAPYPEGRGATGWPDGTGQPEPQLRNPADQCPGPRHPARCGVDGFYSAVPGPADCRGGGDQVRWNSGEKRGGRNGARSGWAHGWAG